MARRLALAGLLLAFLAPPALAQNNRNAQNATGAEPGLTSIQPPGVVPGKTSEWTVVGRKLNTVERWLIEGAGLEVVETKAKPDGSTATLTVRTASDAPVGFREIRALGEKGVSNPLIVRVDTVEQAPEIEPNDKAPQAQEVAVGSAVVGMLRPQDIDYFRFVGRKGRRLVFEVEAQRLGVPLLPVLTLLHPRGTSLAQVRETPGNDRDCRFSFDLPDDGEFRLQLRDNTYSGADGATYRLRIVEETFATALFPLGGAKGQTITLTASGGNLAQPITREVKLPDEPTDAFDPGRFPGAIACPMRLAVGEGPEVTEQAADSGGESRTPLPLGSVGNGRIEKADEVDRWTVAVKKGKSIRVRVVAAALGSWLDSVVTLRDAKGEQLAENDDVGVAQQNNNQQINLAGPPPTDSELLHEPKADGDITIEVADRYGYGGPEFDYRLEVTEGRPEFRINLLLGDVAGAVRAAAGGERNRAAPGANAALNLKPGERRPINFQVAADGPTGPVEVHAEGLPPGVTATKTSINPVAPARNNQRNRPPQYSSGAIELRVAPDAEAALGELRLVAVARPKEGPPVVRTAKATLPIDSVNMPGGRSVSRSFDRIPVYVAGKKPTPAAPGDGSADRGNVRIAGVTVPGVLYLGGRLELEVRTEPEHLDPKMFKLEAKSDGRGIRVDADAPTGSAAPPTVKVAAAEDAIPGVRTVTLTLKAKDGPEVTESVHLIVRPPIRVRAAESSSPDGTLRVNVEREAGFEGPVELRFNGLPEGVEAKPPLIVPAEADSAEVRFEGKSGAVVSSAVGVIGVVRMPGGLVRVESANRASLTIPAAE